MNPFVKNIIDRNTIALQKGMNNPSEEELWRVILTLEEDEQDVLVAAMFCEGLTAAAELLGYPNRYVLNSKLTKIRNKIKELYDCN